MAVFTFSDPQPVFTRSSGKPSILRRLFDAMVDARMAQTRAEIAEHTRVSDHADETVATTKSFDLDAAIVGKKGVYAWPY